MDRTNYITNQRLVTSDDLNNTEATKASQSVLRTQSQLGNSSGVGGSGSYIYMSASVDRGGVYGSPADYLATLGNLYVSKVSESQLTVASGTALDINGNLIILSSSKTLISSGSDSNYAWTLYPDSMNYVKISYAEQTGSLVEDVFGNMLPTRYTGSYYIDVDSSVPNDSQILLATFVANATGGVTSVTDRRLYVTTVIPANAVILDPMLSPIASHISFQDHVEAVGSGVPSSTNPHGILYSDINAAPSGSNVTNLSFSTVTSQPLLAPNTVYQNSSGSLLGLFIMCSMSVFTVEEIVGSVQYSMQASSAGTVGSPGSLTSPITLDTVKFSIDADAVGSASGSLTYTLMGMIPSGWYYHVSSTMQTLLGSTGSIIKNTYFL